MAQHQRIDGHGPTLHPPKGPARGCLRRPRVHSTSIREGAQGHYDPEVLEVWVDAFNPENFPKNIEIMEFYVAELGTDALPPSSPSTWSRPKWIRSMWHPGAGASAWGLFSWVLPRNRPVSAGLKNLWLDSSLNAVSFYSGFGWKEVEHHVRVRRGVEIPVVKMEKTILGAPGPPDPCCPPFHPGSILLPLVEGPGVRSRISRRFPATVGLWEEPCSPSKTSPR